MMTQHQCRLTWKLTLKPQTNHSQPADFFRPGDLVNLATTVAPPRWIKMNGMLDLTLPDRSPVCFAYIYPLFVVPLCSENTQQSHTQQTTHNKHWSAIALHYLTPRVEPRRPYLVQITFKDPLPEIFPYTDQRQLDLTWHDYFETN